MFAQALLRSQNGETLDDRGGNDAVVEGENEPREVTVAMLALADGAFLRAAGKLVTQ